MACLPRVRAAGPQVPMLLPAPLSSQPPAGLTHRFAATPAVSQPNQPLSAAASRPELVCQPVCTPPIGLPSLALFVGSTIAKTMQSDAKMKYKNLANHFSAHLNRHLSTPVARARAAIAKRFAQGPYCTPVDADATQLGANPPTSKNRSRSTGSANKSDRRSASASLRIY